jgi:hypothetical protein
MVRLTDNGLVGLWKEDDGGGFNKAEKRQAKFKVSP